MSFVSALHNLLHDIEGVTEEDLDRVEAQAEAEEARLKTAVQTEVASAKAEALAAFEAAEPEIKTKVEQALALVEAAVVHALAS